MSLLFLLLALVLNAIRADDYPPEQIHISVGYTPDKMVFNWLTFDYPPTTWSRVHYGTNPDDLAFQKIGVEHEFIDPWDKSETPRTIHVTIVSDLQPSTRYYYEVGDRYGGMSDIYSFKTGPNADTVKQSLPYKYIIYGDLGMHPISMSTINMVTQEVENGAVDTVIHVGDIAYNMYEQDGDIGDTFMNLVQPIAVKVPYMVCAGNHEKYENYSHYSFRYWGQPSQTGYVWTGAGQTPNNWYYSWNEGLVHWIAIATEIYFDFPWMIEDQWNWLQQDLEEANNNRAERPWVIVYGHKQIYCSDPYNDGPGRSAETLRLGVWDDGQRRWGLEELFYAQGVDFYFDGHQHNYERTYPVYRGVTDFSYENMTATVYLNVGMAGAKRGVNEFHCQPTNNEECAPWSAARVLSLGYSRFYVNGPNSVTLQFIISDPMLKGENDDEFYEEVTYTQQHHGPFSSGPKQNYNKTITIPPPTETVDLFAKFGYETPVAMEDVDAPIPYISGNKEDYKGIDGVKF